MKRDRKDGKLEKFIKFTLQVIFSLIAMIALIPTNIVRYIKSDSDYHLKTMTKSIDFIIGLAIFLGGTLGTTEALYFVLKMLFSINLTIQQYLLYMPFAIIFLGISLLFLITTICSFTISIPKIKEKLWDVE